MILLHYIRLTAFFQETLVSRHQKGKPFWILLEQKRRWDGSGISWTICKSFAPCSSLRTDNHASTSSLSFYRPDALPAAQPTASKHWRKN